MRKSSEDNWEEVVKYEKNEEIRIKRFCLFICLCLLYEL